MKFDKYYPNEKLKPYIKYFVVSENDVENEYKVFPSTGLVIGFQYKGQLNTILENAIRAKRTTWHSSKCAQRKELKNG